MAKRGATGVGLLLAFGIAAGAAPARDAAQPRPASGPHAEGRGFESGGPGSRSGPGSAELARAVERVRGERAPVDEVFALIRVSDRRTGERVMFARGNPDPAIGRYLHRPETAPAGRSYVDVETLRSDREIEISIRSIRARNEPEVKGVASAEEERERDLLRRNGGSPLGHRIEAGLRGVIERGEVDLRAGADRGMTPVMIALRDLPRLSLPKSEDPEVGGLLWTALEIAAARERAIIDRKRSMAERQAPLLREVERHGGVVRYASWMSGLVQTLLPGAAIAALKDHPLVHSLEFIPPVRVLGAKFDGADVFTAMNGQDFDVNHQGFHGDQAKHPATSRVYVAMGEECVDTLSPAWQTDGSTANKRGLFYDCDPGTCTLGGLEVCWDDDSDGGNWKPHGHYVAGVMAGDLMDGQVGSLTATQRRRITGTCPECRLLFMQDQGLDDRPKVHDLACEKGVDIFEESLGWNSGDICNGEGFMDDSVESLVDCDVVYVSSAGNVGTPLCELECCAGASYSACSTLYPADHPWTFAVSGLNTEESCDAPGEYYTSTCFFDRCSSRGGGDYNGYDGSASIVDLAAPWRVGMGITPGTVSGGGASLVGTSFGAPLLAGLMAEMMDWYKVHLSHAIFHNNRMRNFMLLFGDRSSEYNGTSQNLAGLDKRWGAGRVGLVPFDSLSGTIIQRLELTLGKNQSYTTDLDLLPGGALYKAVLWHTGKNYEDEPRIDLTLDPLGCNVGNMTWHESDSKSLLTHPWIGGCSQVRVTIKNTGVGSSGTRTFHFAAYHTPQTTERSF